MNVKLAVVWFVGFGGIEDRFGRGLGINDPAETGGIALVASGVLRRHREPVTALT